MRVTFSYLGSLWVFEATSIRDANHSQCIDIWYHKSSDDVDTDGRCKPFIDFAFGFPAVHCALLNHHYPTHTNLLWWSSPDDYNSWQESPDALGLAKFLDKDEIIVEGV